MQATDEGVDVLQMGQSISYFCNPYLFVPSNVASKSQSQYKGHYVRDTHVLNIECDVTFFTSNPTPFVL